MRYKLEKGSKKYICPNCGKKSYVRYIDSTFNLYLDFEYGRCDREDKCRYHNKYTSNYSRSAPPSRSRINTNQNIVHFDYTIFKRISNTERYSKNIFIKNLMLKDINSFNINDINNVISIYKLGTIIKGYRAGAITFPFIDTDGNVRAIQVKQFDNNNHTIGTDFLHSMLEKDYQTKGLDIPKWLALYKKQERIISCLFGEHLLKNYPNNPIALVEAPKTAIYASLYFGCPHEDINNFIWLAVYNKSSFSFEKLKVLEGRKIYVFPDLSKDGSTHNEWKRKAKEYEKLLPNTTFIFSDLLEKGATSEEKENGLDLADYLIKYNWKDFRDYKKV